MGSWNTYDGYLGRYRMHRAKIVSLIAELRADPASNRKLYRLVSVHRLRRLGPEIGISARQARRLALRDPRPALLHELFGPTTRNRRKAMALVAELRAQLEAAGFRHAVKLRRRIRHPLRTNRPLPPVALVKKLRDYEIRALDDAV